MPLSSGSIYNREYAERNSALHCGEAHSMNTQVAVAVITASAAGVGLAFAALLAMARPTNLPEDVDPPAALKFSEGERDRMQAVAKGAAASSAGFLTAVLTAALKGEIAKEVSATSLVLVLLGSLGMLLLAAAQSLASARYMAGAVSTYALKPRAQESLKW